MHISTTSVKGKAYGWRIVIYKHLFNYFQIWGLAILRKFNAEQCVYRTKCGIMPFIFVKNTVKILKIGTPVCPNI